MSCPSHRQGAALRGAGSRPISRRAVFLSASAAASGLHRRQHLDCDANTTRFCCGDDCGPMHIADAVPFVHLAGGLILNPDVPPEFSDRWPARDQVSKGLQGCLSAQFISRNGTTRTARLSTPCVLYKPVRSRYERDSGQIAGSAQGSRLQDGHRRGEGIWLEREYVQVQREWAAAPQSSGRSKIRKGVSRECRLVTDWSRAKKLRRIDSQRRKWLAPDSDRALDGHQWC